MGSLDVFFEQFTSEMLSKPSQANTLLELQTELAIQRGITNRTGSDEEMFDASVKEADSERQVAEALNQELTKAFADLFKI
jgi:hypothetical protein